MAKVVLTSLTAKDFSQTDINNTVTKSLDLLGHSFGSNIKDIVIKPNLCYYWDYSTGETTDPRVIAPIIDYMRNRLGRDIDISIVEADASAMKTKYCFKALGYDKLSEIKGVNLVNLSEGNIIDVNVEVAGAKFTLPINEIMLRANLRINVPKLRTHNTVGMTCALKNIFGAIAKPRKYAYHSNLPQAIVGANKAIRSDICIVDGIVAKGSVPRKLGTIIASDDPLANDYVAAKIMRFNPKRVQYLNLATKEKIGNTDKINLVEDNITLAEIRAKFPHYNYQWHRLSWKLQLKILRAYAYIVGDVIPPVLEK